MPSTTAERAARWPGMDSQACEYLKKQGYTRTLGFCWCLPPPVDGCKHKITLKEDDAIIYLVEEWDYGGVSDE